MRVVILGAGRVGAQVAETLDKTNEVTIIDRNPASFNRLGEGFTGQTIEGNGLDVDVLIEAGVEEADLFLALTQEDDSNLMAAQVARQLGAKRAIVRVYDPVRADIFGSEGLRTFSPTVLGAQRLFDLVATDEEK